MLTLLDSIYYKLRREEIERAYTRLKRIKVDTILQNLTKQCWKYNIQYELIIKTKEILIIKLIGFKETVVLKYHKTNVVSKDEIDFFMAELDENNADKGVYITTGEFESREKLTFRTLFTKRDLILEDYYTFIKSNLGIRGKTIKDFNIYKLNFYKYFPR